MKKSFEEFKAETIEILSSMVPEGWELKIEKQEKGVNKGKTSWTITKPDPEIWAVTYFEDLYKDNATEEEIREYARYIIDENDHAYIPSKLDLDYIKEHGYLRMCNTERNKASLKDRITVPNPGTDITLYIVVEYKVGKKFGAFVLTDQILEKIGVSVPEYADMICKVVKNTVKRVAIENLGERVKRMSGDELEESPLYFLGGESSEACLFSECLMYADFNCYIIPSSVHEVLLIKDTDANPADLKEMVVDVNKHVLEDKDFLSDSIYHWDYETKSLTMVII